MGGLQELAEKISDPSTSTFEPQSNPAGQYVPVSLPVDPAASPPWEVEEKPTARIKPTAKSVSNTRPKGLFH